MRRAKHLLPLGEGAPEGRMRVIRWRGPVAIHLAFFRDNQMLAPLARDGGGPNVRRYSLRPSRPPLPR
jgi:hypothetical protein